MKNFETPVLCLGQAAEAIKEGIELGIYKGHLCWFEKHLTFQPSGHTKDNHTVFIKITKDMTDNGLSTDEWNVLNRRLWNYFKELR